MKRRIIWLVVSVLMAVSLVLASCAPKVTEEKEVAKEGAVTEEKKVVTEEKKVVTEEKKVVAKEAGLLPYQKVVPKYGGILNLQNDVDPLSLDQMSSARSISHQYTMHQTNDVLTAYDRTKGPAGTGEWMEGYPFQVMVGFQVGNLAESWELDWPNSVTLHIRKGIHFQNKPPANGREMTAEDVVVSLRRLWDKPGSYAVGSMGGLRDMKNVANSIYLDPDDPWTVVVESNPDLGGLTWEQASMQTAIVPKELKDTTITRWQDTIGTGPFLITDYVSGSSVTFQRNPNYWKKDPLYPQNQLPYVDTLKIFIMPDWASRMAAVQTGKIDRVDSVVRDQAESLWKFSPELLYKRYALGSPAGLAMRHDVKPFDDVRVRRAMMMAIDHEEILRDYYKGDGVLFHWPAQPLPDMMYMWTPLEEMPESVKVLYQYHPDEAGKLLDEAGYPGPKRFTTSVMVYSEEQIDMASLVASYWAKVGVTLNIDVREYGAYQAALKAKTYPHGTLEGPSSIETAKFCVTASAATRNYAMIRKDYVEEALKGVSTNIFNREETARIIKEVTVKMQEDALILILPIPYFYRFWQPWVKGYYGEYGGSYLQSGFFTQYAWIDQELKQKMTGRR